MAASSDTGSDVRVYARDQAVVFRRTKEAFGGLSNMAAGFPLRVAGADIRTSEALYQALRFPREPELQRMVIEARSPMTAKMKTKPHRSRTRPDWDAIRVDLMRWCLRVKLAENSPSFGELLRATGDRPIVEESVKDTFWGARPREDGTLVGRNVLGRLLMELRQEWTNDPTAFVRVDPPEVPDFLLLGMEIGAVLASKEVAETTADLEPTLFDESPHKETVPQGATTVRQPMDRTEPYRKKLIEVALPLEAINTASAREKSIRHGHPSTLHLWWARRPLAACRAVLFASIVDDPSSRPDLFPTEEEHEAERQRLFRLIEELVKWENTTNETVLEAAREEIRKATDGNPPPVLDPFCGGGSIPLEAQRLGLEAHASDLNPVAVLITRALIEIPPKFAGKPPVNPESRDKLAQDGTWKGAQGLAEDVRYYGKWMRDQAFERIGHLYPKAKLSDGREATVIAWIWARTVTCPNPACGATMPLVRSFALSTKKGNEWHVKPVVEGAAARFEIRAGAQAREGTVGRRGAQCLVCETAVPLDHVRAEGKAGRMGRQMLAVVTERDRDRVYLPPDPEHEKAAETGVATDDAPDTSLPEQALGFRVQGYGMTKHRDLFTPRQLVTLTTFSDLVAEARARVNADCDDEAYGDAVATYLAFAVDKLADTNSVICTWQNDPPRLRATFSRQALPMTWDFAEACPFGHAAGDYELGVKSVCEVLERLDFGRSATAHQLDATAAVNGVSAPLVCTDPPYYDNVPYADLSDIFYVWARRSLASIYPDLFSTLLTPKARELVADAHRFGGSRSEARQFFEDGMAQFFTRVYETADSLYPTTLFYAFKQAESDEGTTASTGWDTMLTGLVAAGFSVTGTWPMRSELGSRIRSLDSNALASSIVLVCRPRATHAAIATRREFVDALRSRLPSALRDLQHGNIAPVDLAQAAIGPGMAIFSRYAKVVEADGQPMTVRAALGLINQALDEILAEQEGDFDPDTRFAVTWFEQRGTGEGPYGEADVLARAKDTSVAGMERAGVLVSRAGKVRLRSRVELDGGWDPATDSRLTVWEVTQHLVKRLDQEGESAAADVLRRVGSDYGETARELAYRLFTVCERKGWAEDALGYNALVIAWPEIARLAAGSEPTQESLEV